jgi:hypothetical protein
MSGRGFVDFFVIVTDRQSDRMQLYKYRWDKQVAVNPKVLF